MKQKKLKLSVLLLLGIGLTSIKAQQATTASGGNASGNGGSVSYSLGQVVYTTNIGSSGLVTQGVQQPFEISITTGLAEEDININISAYPNPTTEFLTLQVDVSTALNIQRMLYQLFDIRGKLLESKQVTANATTIAMNELAAATYFLKVIQNKKEIKTFTIIKN